MRMDKLTSRFQQALADAQSLAVGRDHPMLEPAHVLVALIDQRGGSTAPMLAQTSHAQPAEAEWLHAVRASASTPLPSHHGQPRLR